MKMSFLRVTRWVGACIVASLAFSVGSLYSQESDTTCPFADDEVILYHSPSTLANVQAVRSVWDCDEAKEALNAVLDKIDSAVAESIEKEQSDVKREQFNYFKSIISDASKQDSFSRALLGCYFKYLDGVVWAFDFPEDASKPENFLAGISVTYVLNENPKGIDVGKLIKKDDYEVVRSNESEIVAKLIVRDAEKITGQIFFGYSKVKDMDKYVLVFAGTQDGVDKKIKRFQSTNEFLTKRLNGDQLYADSIFKSAAFEALNEQLAKKQDDQNAKNLRNFTSKIKSVNFQARGVDNGVNYSLKVEAVDAASAKDFADLALGGLAVLKMKADGAAANSTEAKVGNDLLKQIEIKAEDGQSVAVASATFDVELLKQTLKTFVWNKVKEAASK